MDNTTLFNEYHQATDEVRKSELEAMIFERNYPLAVSIGKRYRYLFEEIGDIEDAIQEAYIGLLKAIRTFDVSKGFRFSSYAATCIENHFGHIWLVPCQLSNDGLLSERPFGIIKGATPNPLFKETTNE